MLRAFLSKRQHDPDEGENVLRVEPRGRIKSLHVGSGRGATIYDRQNDTCWLLAFDETHAVGERRDAYVKFERLSARGELLPTKEDVMALSTVTTADVIDALRAHSAGLYDKAAASSGEEIYTSLTLDDGQSASITISIELLIEQDDRAEQGWIAFVLPHDPQVPEAQILDLIADMLPGHVDVDTLDHAADVNGRAVRFNELAFTWQHYSDAG